MSDSFAKLTYSHVVLGVTYSHFVLDVVVDKVGLHHAVLATAGLKPEGQVRALGQVLNGGTAMGDPLN